MGRRGHRSFLQAAFLVLAGVAAGCGSTAPPPKGAGATGTAPDTIESPDPHDCLPGFDATAMELKEFLRQRNGTKGRGWALRLQSAEDFLALESICIDLSVALDRDVMARTWRGGGETAPTNLQSTCVALRGILAYDRSPPSGALNHLDSANRGWLKRPPGYPSVPGAEELFLLSKEALDM